MFERSETSRTMDCVGPNVGSEIGSLASRTSSAALQLASLRLTAKTA